jgi:HEPN domain-containing protein
VREWFDIADTELASAEYLVTMRRPSPDAVVCYLCQQAAEKYFKGFLVMNNIDPPKTHNLLELSKLCMAAQEGCPLPMDFSTLTTKCAFLNPYGVMPRYPNELQITVDDAKVALLYANDIKVFIRSVV